VTDIRERAIDLLERHIRNGTEAAADPRVTARECLLALEGLGYRPTEARPAADWRMRQAGHDPSQDSRAALEAVRAQCAVSPTRVHPDDSQLGAAS
jgi:Holliday junction resolvasome RuvABC DNA-binding subunit